MTTTYQCPFACGAAFTTFEEADRHAGQRHAAELKKALNRMLDSIKYSYVSKNAHRELRIPFSQITVRELHYFTEAVCDADEQIVRVNYPPINGVGFLVENR